MKKNKIKLLVSKEDWPPKVRFAILDESFGKRGVATNLEFTTLSEGEVPKELFSMTEDSTQELFNRLWQIGFRPKDGTGNDGHVGAILD